MNQIKKKLLSRWQKIDKKWRISIVIIIAVNVFVFGSLALYSLIMSLGIGTWPNNGPVAAFIFQTVFLCTYISSFLFLPTVLLDVILGATVGWRLLYGSSSTK